MRKLTYTADGDQVLFWGAVYSPNKSFNPNAKIPKSTAPTFKFLKEFLPPLLVLHKQRPKPFVGPAALTSSKVLG